MALDLVAALESDNRDAVREVRLVTVRSKEKTLAELFRVVHMAKEADWGHNHTLAQKRYAEFWLAEFGPKTPLSHVTAHEVEQRAKKYPAGPSNRRKFRRGYNRS